MDITLIIIALVIIVVIVWIGIATANYGYKKYNMKMFLSGSFFLVFCSACFLIASGWMHVEVSTATNVDLHIETLKRNAKITMYAGAALVLLATIINILKSSFLFGLLFTSMQILGAFGIVIVIPLAYVYWNDKYQRTHIE